MLPNGVDRPEPSPQSVQSLPWSPSMAAQGGGQTADERTAEPSVAPPRLPEIARLGPGDDERTPLRDSSSNLRGSGAATEWPPALKWMGRLNELFAACYRTRRDVYGIDETAGNRVEGWWCGDARAYI